MEVKYVDDNYTLPFGKYFGQKIANVPATYLKWLWDSKIVGIGKWGKVYWYIKDNADAINVELKKENKELIETI